MRVSIVFGTAGVSQTVGETRQVQNALGGVGVAATQTSEQSKNAGISVADLAFKFNNVVQAVQTLAAVAKPAYDLLIGQNEKLNQQLLASRANLVATNKILSDGVEISDPTQAIQALNEPVKNSIQEIRQASLDVVGVTSGQLVDTFNILTAQAANLANQSKEIPGALDAATKLTTDFAAALGTTGLPLGQARQEINSILTGTIDMNSVLAKQLGITNEQVNQWKSQGVLVDELRKKLQPFVEGNKLAARSIAGITSNIQEVLEVTAQVAGEPLLEPLVSALDELYQFLKQNQDAIQSFSQDAVLTFLELAQAVGDAALRIGEALLPSLAVLGSVGEKAGELGELLVTGFKASAEFLVVLTNLLEPLIFGLAKAIELAVELSVQLIETSQTGIGYLTGSYRESTQAAEAYANATAQLSEEALANNQKLRAAIAARNEAEKAGTELTSEQLKAEKQARQSSESLVQQLKNHRAELLQASLVGTENKENVKSQVVELDNQIKTLEKLGKEFKTSTNNIQIQAKDLKTLGDTYKQLEDKAANAAKVLREGAGGDTTRAQQAAKELVSLTEQRRQLGQISAQEAVKELEAVRTNTKIGFEQQQAAAEAITKIKQQQADKQVADLKFQQQQIQAEVETGKISQVDGEKQITALKQQELEKRLQTTRAALGRERNEGRGNGDTAKQLVEQERQLQVDLLKARIQGVKAVAKVQQAAGEQQVADIKFEQQRVQAAIEAGQIPQIEGERRLTALKQQELEKRLQLTRAALAREQREGRGNGDTAGQLVEQERQLQVDLLKARTEGLKKQQAVYLKDLEVSLGKASDAVKVAESTRLSQIQQLLNQGVISQQEAEKLRLNAKRASIQEELGIERERLNKLLALPKAANSEDEEARQAKIRASRQRSADLQLQLLQSEYEKQQQVKAAAIKGIEERAGAQARATASITADLEREKAAFEAIENSIDTSKRLLESRGAVQRALTNLQQVQSQGEIDGLQQALALRKEIDKTDSPEAKAILQTALNKLVVDGATTELQLIKQRQAIENQIAQQKREAALAEQERARQSLALDLERNKIAAQKALIDARQGENQAKQNLNSAEAKLSTAKQNPQDQEGIRNAQQGVALAKQAIELANQSVKNAQEQVGLQPELAQNEQRKLVIDQKAEIAQLNLADKSRGTAQAMELAQIEAAKFAETLKKAQEAAAAEKQSQTSNSQSPTPESRFTGGPMTAGQPYLVGDGPRGQFIPGVSEVIVPGTNSYVVSARKVAELMNPLSTRAAIPAPASGGSFQQLTREIQGLREDLRQRKPVSNNIFHFHREENEMSQVSQMMDLVRTTMPL